MVLYTPLSEHEIFPSEDEPTQIVEYQGRTMYVRRNEQGQFQLVQLVSTDPQDYLNHSFQPGAILQNEYVQLMK